MTPDSIIKDPFGVLLGAYRGGDTDTSNLAGDNLPIQLGIPVSIKEYIDEQIGDVNAILDQINGVEV